MRDRAGPARRLHGSDAARGTGMRERQGCGSTLGAARSRGTGVLERLGSTFFFTVSVLFLTLFGTVQTAVPRIQYAEPAHEQCENSAKQCRTVSNSAKQCRTVLYACMCSLAARSRAAGLRDRAVPRGRSAGPTRYRASVLRDHRSRGMVVRDRLGPA